MRDVNEQMRKELDQQPEKVEATGTGEHQKENPEVAEANSKTFIFFQHQIHFFLYYFSHIYIRSKLHNNTITLSPPQHSSTLSY